MLQAFRIGAKAHEGQSRKSGEPYITQPVAVAGILAELGLDTETIIAAILHDTLEDTELSREALAGEFGEEVAELVDGVTKLDKMRFGSRQEADAESFRKMLLAMARDLRVILIKLADRLHNMRTLGAKDAASRRRIARETLEIYAPIAQRLGMNKFKAELQDLGFRTLYPDRYRVIRERERVHEDVASVVLAASAAGWPAARRPDDRCGNAGAPRQRHHRHEDGGPLADAGRACEASDRRLLPLGQRDEAVRRQPRR